MENPMDKGSNPISKCNLSVYLLMVKNKKENYQIPIMFIKVNLKTTYLMEKAKSIILITKSLIKVNLKKASSMGMD